MTAYPRRTSDRSVRKATDIAAMVDWDDVTFDEAGVYLSTEHTKYELRQLYTGRDGRRVSVALAGIGAFLALATVSGLAAALGHQLLRRVKLATIRRIGGGVCLALAALSVLGLFGVDVPILG